MRGQSDRWCLRLGDLRARWWYTYTVARSGAPTSHDVARLAGVSQPTVSRALRGDPRLSADTRRRVRAAAEQLHYVPSQLGRSLSTRVAGQVGIVVGDLRNPLLPRGPRQAARGTAGDRRAHARAHTRSR